jgi:hypothetical protein
MEKEELDKYKYLWEEEGWELSAFYHSRLSLRIVFCGNSPTIQELAAVRKLLDGFRERPVNEVKKEIGSVKELFIGDFPSFAGRDLCQKAEKLHLTIIAKDTSFTSYLPFNRKTNIALIIEDGNDSKAITQKMIDSGISIVNFPDEE